MDHTINWNPVPASTPVPARRTSSLEEQVRNKQTPMRFRHTGY